MAALVKRFFKAVSGIIKHKSMKALTAAEKENRSLIEMVEIPEVSLIEDIKEYEMERTQTPVFMGVCL